ncbi:MAG: hypothetical protein VYC39_02700 [Myxococcota bacterium]|nr:hypothetical protein [Myxococcota bacterium]
MSWSETEHKFADAWAIHGKRDGNPWMCGWSKSEESANAEKNRLQKAEADAEFWVMQMTEDELETFKAAGLSPIDN